MPAKAVEKDWLKIAQARVTQPTRVKSYRRILVYSRNKKGKTRFSLSAGKSTTLVLDPERGTDTMRKLNPYVWHIQKWEDINDAYNALRLGTLSPKLLGVGPEEEPFTWVSVDGMTRLNTFALKYIMRTEEVRDLSRRPGIIDRRDYNKSGELMKSMMMQFHTLRMHVVYSAQERVITPDDDDDESTGTLYVPNLPQGARSEMNSIVEVIGRLYVVTVPMKTKGGDIVDRPQRRLWIGVHDNYETGFRSDYVLPDMIKNPTIPKLVSLMLTGTEGGETE